MVYSYLFPICYLEHLIKTCETADELG